MFQACAGRWREKNGQGLCPNGAKSRGRNGSVKAPVKYRGVRGTWLGRWARPGAGGREVMSEVKSEEVGTSWGLTGQVATSAKGGPGQGKSKSKSLEVRANLAHFQTGRSVLLEARWIQCRGTLGPSYSILSPGELGGRWATGRASGNGWDISSTAVRLRTLFTIREWGQEHRLLITIC